MNPTPPSGSVSVPPPAPPIPVDRDTLEQAADLLELLEQWLTRAGRVAARDCAYLCSRGNTKDPDEVAASVGLLADRLYTRIAEVPITEGPSAWS